MRTPTRPRVAPLILAGLLSTAAAGHAEASSQGVAASQLVLAQSAPLRGGDNVSRAWPWIRLTGPAGQVVYMNVDQVTSTRSDTEIPGVRTQLDLASGKFQGVKESIEQVMELIATSQGGRETDEAPNPALTR
jgi:hypothetical protein